MSKFVVEVSDKNEAALKIVVNLPLIGIDSWSSLEKGVWSYNSGAATIIDKTKYNPFMGDSHDGIQVHKHLALSNTPHFSWGGVVLWDFKGWTDANESGAGFMRDGWSLTVGYGNSKGASIIKWRLVG
jgi:hypothetical protein